MKGQRKTGTKGQSGKGTKGFVDFSVLCLWPFASLLVQEAEEIFPGGNPWNRWVRRFRQACQNASGIRDLMVHDVGCPHGLKPHSPCPLDIRFRIVADIEDLVGFYAEMLDEFKKYR